MIWPILFRMITNDLLNPISSLGGQWQEKRLELNHLSQQSGHADEKTNTSY